MRKLLLPLLLAVVLAPASALGDVAPPDTCTTAGSDCNTAPPDYQSPGTCVETTCTKGGPDGSTTYPCTLCQPKGAAGSGGGAGASGASGAAGSPSGSGGEDDDGGCSVRPAPAGAATAFGLLLLGLGALALERRRKQR